MTQANTQAPSTSKAQAVANGKPRRGGKFFVIEGEAKDFRERVKKETGVVSVAGDVVYWGGNDFCRLRHPEQRRLLKDGAWVRMEGDVKEYDGNTYAGSWVLTHVNDEPV